MADAKHTPGPLHVGGAEKCTIYNKYGQRVGNTFEGVPVSQRSDAECRANAVLFAAATDLLVALQGMLEVYGITRSSYEHLGVGSATEVELCEQACAAVAKATGGNHG